MIGDDVKTNTENGENNCNDNLNDSFSLYSIWTETTIATLLALAPNGSRRQKAVILPKVSLISANYLIMTIMMIMMMIWERWSWSEINIFSIYFDVRLVFFRNISWVHSNLKNYKTKIEFELEHVNI